jgi:hypothetical protein
MEHRGADNGAHAMSNEQKRNGPGWKGWDMVYRGRVGIAETPGP